MGIAKQLKDISFGKGRAWHLVILALVLFMPISLFAATSDLYLRMRQISLFRSTKSDVERVFSKAKLKYIRNNSLGRSAEYALKGAKLTATYSQGECTEANPYDYKVEKDIVVEFEIEFDKPIKFTTLALDISKFEKIPLDDVIGLFNYYNSTEGIYFVGTEKTVEGMELYADLDSEPQSCKE